MRIALTPQPSTMKAVSQILTLLVFVLVTGCGYEITDNRADFKFETTDRESNTIGLDVTITYRLKSRMENKLLRKYGVQYKDILLLPVVSTASGKIIKNYSAGEIYSYQRAEIEQRLGEEVKMLFAESDMELTGLFVNSVLLPDTLMQELKKEHDARFQKAMNACTRGTKAVITELRPGDSIFLYEYTIESKKHSGIANQADLGSNVHRGDSITIEYACEEPFFHRLKK